MLKLFKPKKRLTISDIKIPIPMLAGIENATNLTEEQIDIFLRGGKLNIPQEEIEEKRKTKQNLLPVILNEKIQPGESSTDESDYSDSEDDENLIVDLLNKLSREVQQKNEQSFIPNKHSPYVFEPPSVPMTINRKEEKPEESLIITNKQVSTPVKTEEEEPKIPVQKEDIPQTSNVKIEQEGPVIKNHHSSGSSSTTLDVTPTPLKKNSFSEAKQRKKAELYHEKINMLKYQLEQLQQQYLYERHEHLMFVKERESLDNQIMNQINLAKQKLDEIRQQNNQLSIPNKNTEYSRLRGSQSCTNLNEKGHFYKDEWGIDPVALMKSNPMNHRLQYDNTYQIKYEEGNQEDDDFYYSQLSEEREGNKVNAIVSNGQEYKDEFEDEDDIQRRRKRMEAYYRYFDYYYYQSHHNYYEQPYRYYDKKEHIENERREDMYYFYDDDGNVYYQYTSRPRHNPQRNVEYQPRQYFPSRISYRKKSEGEGTVVVEDRGENAYPHSVPFQQHKLWKRHPYMNDEYFN